MRIITCLIVCAATLLADTIVLKNGRTVEGTFLGGDSRSVRIAVGDNVQTLAVGTISQINFGSYNSSSSGVDTTSGSSSSSANNSSVLSPSAQRSSNSANSRNNTGRRSDNTSRSNSNSNSRYDNNSIEIPVNTAFVVRLIDDVDSERDDTGKTYRASLDEALIVNDRTVIQKGADVTVKLIDDKESGKLTGRTVLTLGLDSMMVNGRNVMVQTSEVTEQSGSRGARTAKTSAGVAAVGAIIGGIAGGGSGAAIGAATGAAVGAGSQVLMKGQRVRVPSETRLTFTLLQPIWF